MNPANNTKNRYNQYPARGFTHACPGLREQLIFKALWNAIRMEASQMSEATSFQWVGNYNCED